MSVKRKGKTKATKVLSAEGYVKFVFNKKVENKRGEEVNTTSIVLIEDSADLDSRDKTIGEWYSLGFDGDQDLAKGMYISFDYVKNNKFKNVDIDTIEEDEDLSLDTDDETDSNSTASSKGSNYNPNGEAWGNALTNAVKLFEILMYHELLTIKGKKDNDKLKQAVLTVQQLRIDLFSFKDIPNNEEVAETSNVTEDEEDDEDPADE